MADLSVVPGHEEGQRGVRHVDGPSPEDLSHLKHLGSLRPRGDGHLEEDHFTL